MFWNAPQALWQSPRNGGNAILNKKRRGTNMRSSVILLAALGLAACEAKVPDSGVGFQDYNTYIKNQTVAAAEPAPSTGFSPEAAAAAIDAAEGKPAAATGAPLAAPGVAAVTTGAVIGASTDLPAGERARGNAPAGIAETTSEMTGAGAGTVSDEQDFAAVTQRESIESDKARIEANRAQYQIDQPTALPQRTEDGAPNIVAFALSTTNPVGVQMYSRSSLRLSSFEAACGKFASPDLAQMAFLEAGGPKSDRKGLDPDGDGFACAWDPTPFRLATQ
jgi:hypothetical protein